ncbi:MAG: hypothetical protein OJF62_000248 [Pseudolabrys sp.]|jgi:uncharacterized protein (DUF488 family)|nr:hypothetical protein [Pseudolabrys sp.]
MSKRAKTAALFTIGYERAKQPAVFDELRQAKVDVLVDVRAVTASRRPGFSKRQLAAALDEHGIAYVHLQKLGTPAEGRQAARADDIKALWRIFDKHMKSAPAQAQLDELVGLVKTGKRICVMCYCRDASTCHRSHITAAVKDRVRVTVEDLVPPLF